MHDDKFHVERRGNESPRLWSAALIILGNVLFAAVVAALIWCWWLLA